MERFLDFVLLAVAQTPPNVFSFCAVVLQIPLEKVFRHPKPTERPLAKGIGARGVSNAVSRIPFFLQAFLNLSKSFGSSTWSPLEASPTMFGRPHGRSVI